MMFFYMLLSTVHASGNARARSMQQMSCRPTSFWSKLGYKINSSKNDYLVDLATMAMGDMNDAVAALMHLQTLEHRVVCQDVDGDVKPCTDLYTTATCQEVGKFFRPEGDSNCKAAGTQEGLTQLECKRPRHHREVCNGTYYAHKNDSFFGMSKSIICLEGWTFAPGHELDSWKKISDVDCSDPACFEMSRAERMEVARVGLVNKLKLVTEEKTVFGIKVNPGKLAMKESTFNILKSVLKVLEGEPLSDVLLDHLAEVLTDLWEDAMTFFVDLDLF